MRQKSGADGTRKGWGNMRAKLVLPITFPGLNAYIAAERSHRQKAAKMKKQYQDTVMLFIRSQRLPTFDGPVYMYYTWVEKDRRRDKDNVAAFGRKVIQDALVKAGVLKNDGWANIAGFSEEARTMLEKRLRGCK